MEINPDIYYNVPQIIYVSFSLKINHNHSETFLYFTNIKKGEILKNFEVGSLGKYCDHYISFTNTKITCLKTLTFDTIDLGSQPETVLKAFDGIEEFYITGRLDERNKFTEIINNQFPGSKIFYTVLDEGR
jgi:hypothetical protein